jgi:uracil DNA glycosylase
LNATLTVEDSHPGSHQKKVGKSLPIALFNFPEKSNLVFVLWVDTHKKKGTSIRTPFLKSPHPSFLSHSGFSATSTSQKLNITVARQKKLIE